MENAKETENTSKEVTEEEIKSLLVKKSNLHSEVMRAIQGGDPNHYIDVFSEKVPQIVNIERELFEYKKQGVDVDSVSIYDKEVLTSHKKDLELSAYRDFINRLLNDGGFRTSPNSKDITRVDSSILKNKNPSSSASRMYKITEDLGKLYCRGKVLIERGREDLAEGFWKKVLDALDIPYPKVWGGKGLSNTSDFVEIKSKNDFTDEKKVELFDAIFNETSEAFRKVIECDEDVTDHFEPTFISNVSLLGSDAKSIIKKKIDENK